MSNRELPFLPWYPDQFAASTRAMRYAERCAYRALLDAQWALGILPDDTERLALSIGALQAEFDAVWPSIAHKFERVAGGLQNFRLEQHRLAAFQRKERHRKGAEWTNAKRIAERPAKRTPSDTLSGTPSDTLSGTPPSPSPSPSPDISHTHTGARGVIDRGPIPEAIAETLDAWKRDVPECDPEAFARWIVHKETRGHQMGAAQRLIQARQLASNGDRTAQAEVVEYCIGHPYYSLIPIGDVRRRTRGISTSPEKPTRRLPKTADELEAEERVHARG